MRVLFDELNLDLVKDFGEICLMASTPLLLLVPWAFRRRASRSLSPW